MDNSTTDNGVLYEQALKAADSAQAIDRSCAPVIEAEQVHRVLDVLNLRSSVELFGDRMLHGSVDGRPIPCNRRSHWFPFRSLLQVILELLRAVDAPLSGLSGGAVASEEEREIHAVELAYRALEQLGVYEFYAYVGRHGAWVELAGRGTDNKPLTTASNTLDVRVYTTRRDVVLGVCWLALPQPQLFSQLVPGGSKASNREAEDDLRLLLARLAPLLDVATPRMLEVLRKLADPQAWVPGSEILQALAAAPRASHTAELLPALNDTLMVFGCELQPFGWMGGAAAYAKLAPRLEAAAKKWAQAELRRLNAWTKPMQAWILARLIGAIVLARGDDDEGASVFAVEWARVRLDDLPGFPEWLADLEALFWGRWKEITFVFRTYALEGCLRPQDFSAFTRDAGLRSKTVTVAKVDLLFTAMKNKYRDQGNQNTKPKESSSGGLTSLGSFMDALVRLALLMAEANPLPPGCKFTPAEKFKKGKPILLPACVLPLLATHLAQASEEAARTESQNGDGAALTALSEAAEKMALKDDTPSMDDEQENSQQSGQGVDNT